MKKFFTIFFILIGAPDQVNAQGCSDAGFCTMGAMKQIRTLTEKLILNLEVLSYPTIVEKQTKRLSSIP
ncbi:MAG: hypothetical protein AAFO69_15250 [Bacteroidota bacterium]